MNHKRDIRGFRTFEEEPWRQKQIVAERWFIAKLLGLVIAVLSVVVSCSHWISEDDKRMYKSFVANCERKNEQNTSKPKTDCGLAWTKAYEDTFGRSP